VLCKDFVVHPNQLMLARAAGADAVLIMVSVLGGLTAAFVKAARDCGLTPLVEVHGEHEYAIARDSGADLIGVNARDLRDLTVDTAGSLDLIARAAGEGFVVVAESGIRERTDVEAAAEAGARAVLVGETLMRSDDVGATLRNLTGVRVRAGARP
jgi:indole-3-glycerol phosphate synthase